MHAKKVSQCAYSGAVLGSPQVEQLVSQCAYSGAVLGSPQVEQVANP